jgi:hypothetical protein
MRSYWHWIWNKARFTVEQQRKAEQRAVEYPALTRSTDMGPFGRIIFRLAVLFLHRKQIISTL